MYISPRLHRQAISNLRDVDLRHPLNPDHELNQGRAAWWLALPNRFGGPKWWDLCAGYAGTLTNFSTGNGWNNEGYNGSAGSIYTPKNAINDTTAPNIITPKNVASYTGGGDQLTALIWANVFDSSGTQAYCCFSDDNDSPDAEGAVIFANISGGSQVFWGRVCNTTQTIGNGATVSGGTWNSHTWYRIGLAYNGSTLSLWVNGKQITSTSQSGNVYSAATPLRIGQRGSYGDGTYGPWPWYGLLNDFTLYNYGWSAELFALDYQLGPQGYPGVLNRSRRIVYSLPKITPPAGKFRPVWATRKSIILGTGVY